jgi:hypothetical protein
MFKKLFFLTLCFVVICSCKNPVKDNTHDLFLPQTLLMKGQAYHVDTEGRTCDCRFEFIIELKSETRRTDRFVEYEGNFGGGVKRMVLDPDGNGICLWPDLYAGLIARFIFPDWLELKIPLNTNTESRFYRALSFFSCRIDELGNGSGRWTCAPFDIDQGGYTDTLLVAHGEWSIRPLSGN